MESRMDKMYNEFQHTTSNLQALLNIVRQDILPKVSAENARTTNTISTHSGESMNKHVMALTFSYASQSSSVHDNLHVCVPFFLDQGTLHPS